MGVEIQTKINNGNITTAVAGAAPVILGLQPAALVDHVARVDWSLLSRIPGESGGSFPVNSPHPLSVGFVCVMRWFFFFFLR